MEAMLGVQAVLAALINEGRCATISYGIFERDTTLETDISEHVSHKTMISGVISLT